MKNLIIILFSFFLVAGLQCPKESFINQTSTKPEMILPPISTSGLNTIGCKIDGKVWVPYSERGNWLFPGPSFLNAGINRNQNWKLAIGGMQLERQSKNDINVIEIYISQLNTDTVFILTKNRKGNFGYYVPIMTPCFTPDSNTCSPAYFTDESLNNGAVQILKFDSIKQIVSGTFYFTVIDSTTKIKHEITDGRFDLRYAY